MFGGAEQADVAASVDLGAEILAAPASQRLALVEFRALREQIDVVLGMSADSIAPTMGLMDLGLDSLTIVELGLRFRARNWASRSTRPVLRRAVGRQSGGGAARLAPGQRRPAEETPDESSPAVERRLYVLATPGCPVVTLRTWFAGDHVTVERTPGRRVRHAVERLASEPGSSFVHVACDPFVAVERSELSQRAAESTGPAPTATSSTSPSRSAPSVVPSPATRTSSPCRTPCWSSCTTSWAGALRDQRSGSGRVVDSSEADAWLRVGAAECPGRGPCASSPTSLTTTCRGRRRGQPGHAGPAPEPPAPPAAPPAPRPVAGRMEPPAPILPVPRDRPLIASSAQERLLFVDDLKPGLAVYNLPIGFRVTGRLDVAALESAFSEIVRRHEALRTNFDVVDGRYVQIVAKAVPVLLELEDLRSLLPYETRCCRRGPDGSGGDAPLSDSPE